jgi:hypothetical protein
MTWLKFAVRDARGRYWRGGFEPFSVEKHPRLWSKRRYALTRIEKLNRYQNQSWAADYAYPLEVAVVLVTA